MTVVPMKIDLAGEHTTYFTKDGKRQVGVTTVLGILSKPPLLKWYATTERDGILKTMGDGNGWSAAMLRAQLPLYKTGSPQPFAEIRRDKAADVGTVTHARIEAWLKGTTLDPDGIPPEVYAQSVYGMDRFMEFWDHERLSLIASERVMVSEKSRIGGTADVLAIVEGRRILVDIKTNTFNQSWPYPEHIAQASQYAGMAEEEDGIAVDEVWLVRVGKDPADRTQVVKLTKEQRAAGLELFSGALVCYNARKLLD
jgi:hypothetical protein